MRVFPSHEDWMKIALEEARSAFYENEVPIGAVLVKSNKPLYRNHNRTNQTKNPLAHAEKLVIEAAINDGEKFLQDYTIYVTVEPCLMCAGMMIWSRLGCLIYGARDSKGGAVGSIYNVLRDKSFNHQPRIISGVMAEECSLVLKDFFQSDIGKLGDFLITHSG